MNVLFLVSGRLAPTLVYDDGCHLVAYIRNHIGRELMRTEALNLLATTPVSVDRLHFKNHVGRFCRKEMDPNKNRCMRHVFFRRKAARFHSVLDNINTEAAEQCFSWLKRYATMISSMNWMRAPVFMVIIFHLKNLSYVRRRPSDVFLVVS